MSTPIRFLLTIAEPNGEVRSLGTVRNTTGEIRRLVKRPQPVSALRACYEAGPTGYVLYWQLTELKVRCEVIAPSLIPVKASNRVKARHQAELDRQAHALDQGPRRL